MLLKDKNKPVKRWKDENAETKNFCLRKDIGLIENYNLQEGLLGTKNYF